jgi:hypothetical protein
LLLLLRNQWIADAEVHRTIARRYAMRVVTLLAVGLLALVPSLARADEVTPPLVPANIAVPAGNKAFFVGHAVGTQNYICLPCPNPITPLAMCPASGFAFALFTPQATLFEDADEQVITHFFSPNPFEKGTIRATWRDSRDTSTVWARVNASSSDPAFVAAAAIPWLLLQVVGAQEGPTGGDALTATTFVQRLKTSGGVAPSTCNSSLDVGKEAFVPYTADYFFYKAAESDAEDRASK